MDRKYAAAIRPTESKAYQGNVNGESEISGPAIIAGTLNAKRKPAYRMLAVPRRMSPSPIVKGGVSGRAGLNRNCRIADSRLTDRPLALTARPDGRAASSLSETSGATQVWIIQRIHIFSKKNKPASHASQGESDSCRYPFAL